MDLKEQTGLMSTPQVDFFKENGVNLRFGPLKVTSAIKRRNTAEEIIIYTHTVYSLLLKLERNKA